ncbi:Rrf2 family protein [Halanaerobium congolense]|jgi:Rrf2 family protein|uniref:BadM/Rrf2 family transcriptional regulator n=1 Tax=Halanaerobium congolense TaxID=54121 RepID=A0A1G6NDN6_9FIRM|nr:Rrf2 family transcriptional regulator [Halanaerobium congolense]KXS48753.1 MAG: BadM/Rrf2 family transcriptional regulator [Halanaerobium sp. T82-1]PUU89531.1 MAG: BadM/Rrf2 family transcriptional regulator [Halanaerobium sp.]PTX16416.1 BadM/Rrf2 family transcriptional regulator [Halanaerobium congolense]PXV62441.1 BadM/Rrf2 family transcriptional regulator [Halanaerobium congolense]TDP11558.1 BadM/Rrf2 family transcriptional regulator [Halanaerobium congolense]
MEISAQGRYALRALVDLAVNAKDSALPLREISERQNISERYLEQIFARLKKADLIKSVRGAHGGYLLTRPPEEITVKDIMQVIEGRLAPEVEPEKHSEEELYQQMAQELWTKMESNLYQLLESITLADLKERTLELRKENNEGYMYYI